jgi:hypothetical protein
MVLAALGCAAVSAGVLLERPRRPGGSSVRPAPGPSTSPSTPPIDPRPPDRPGDRGDPTDPVERRRVQEALVDFAERFGISVVPASAGDSDPADLMVLLSRELRYRGPYLSASELARLADEHGPGSSRDRALALRWHAAALRFADDRALPEDFARGPLRWQLDTLAWSFHLDGDRSDHRRAPTEVVHALAAALAVDVPIRPASLAERFPTLTAYLAFLGRLPRR